MFGRAQLTLPFTSGPTKAIHKGWNEILHGLRASDKDKHETLCPHSPVADRHLEGSPVGNMFDATTLREPNSVG